MEASSPGRVLVVGASPLLRGLLVDALQRRDHDVRACAGAEEVLARLAAEPADAVVVGLRLADAPATLGLVETITRDHPRTGVVVLSSVPDLEVALPGAAGLLHRAALVASTEATSADIVAEAIASVTPPGVRRPLRLLGRTPEALAGLSDLQLDLLRRLTHGQSNEQIATERGVSLRAVESLASRTFAALGLHEGTGNPRVRAVTTYLRAMGQM